MAKLLLSLYTEDVKETEKFLKFFPIISKYRKYYINVKHPIKKEEFIYLGKAYIGCRKDNSTYLKFIGGWDEYEKKYTDQVMKTVNRLEQEGYRVPNDQLSLFLKSKITQLILESKK